VSALRIITDHACGLYDWGKFIGINKKRTVRKWCFNAGQDFPTDIGNAKESSIKETKLEAKPLFDVLILF
jgi:hypothetical protein